MKNIPKYSSSDLENLIVSFDKYKMLFSEENYKTFEETISRTNYENLKEVNLDLLVWIHFQNQKKPLNLSFFEHKLFEYVIKKISEKQFNFNTGCAATINYFLTVSQSTNYTELLVKTLAESKDFEQFLYCSKNFQESDLSLVEGTTGILLLLLNLLENTKNNSRIVQYGSVFERIFHQAIQCLLIHILPVSEHQQTATFFPDYVKIENQETVYVVENTLSWAKGDLPKIYLLYKAGHYFQKQAWINLADNMGEYISGLAFEENLDISVAEGTAGGALIYGKLFELTNKPIYQEAHQFYLYETLKNMKTHKPNLTKNLLFNYLGAYLTVQSSITQDFEWAKLLLL